MKLASLADANEINLVSRVDANKMKLALYDGNPVTWQPSIKCAGAVGRTWRVWGIPSMANAFF
eukprot:scaffold280338_cov21-Tisochrysis_lutea.AAC.3